MLSKEEFKHLVNHQYNQEEKSVFGELTQYVETKYGIKLYKILYETVGPSGPVSRIDIYTYWNRDYRHRVDHRLVSVAGGGMRQYVDEENKAKEIVERHGLQHYFHPDDLIVDFLSFEQQALYNCYTSSFEEFQTFRETHFNPDTMERIDPHAMFIVYKSRELMEEAKRNGEQDRLREAYYHFIKPYDTYNFITPDHHLLIYFEYPNHAIVPWEGLGRRI